MSSYQFGAKMGGSEKCDWNTRIDVNQRCHVKVRKWFDDYVDYACSKGRNSRSSSKWQL